MGTSATAGGTNNNNNSPASNNLGTLSLSTTNNNNRLSMVRSKSPNSITPRGDGGPTLAASMSPQASLLLSFSGSSTATAGAGDALLSQTGEQEEEEKEERLEEVAGQRPTLGGRPGDMNVILAICLVYMGEWAIYINRCTECLWCVCLTKQCIYFYLHIIEQRGNAV